MAFGSKRDAQMPSKAVQPSEELMSRQEVADLLGVSARTLETWARDGTGPTYRRIGRRAIYLRSEVDKWILGQPNLGGRPGA